MKKILCLLIFVVLSNIIFAQSISYNEEFKLNDFREEYVNSLSIARLSNNNFIVCWDRFNYNDDEFDNYAIIYNELFEKKVDEFKINTFSTFYQQDPNICELSNGKFVVCWDSDGQDGSGRGIFAQIFDENGARIGNEFQVNSYYNDLQYTPSITNILNYGFVICWSSYDELGTHLGIFAQIFNENGEKIGNEFKVNTNSNNSPGFPSISSLVDNRFVICWDSHYQDGRIGIFDQIFDKSGNKIKEEFLVNNEVVNDQIAPFVKGLKNGDFIICWESLSDDHFVSDIYAQIYDKNGEKSGNEFLVNTTTNYFQCDPFVEELEDGKIIICWTSIDNEFDFNISAQCFDNKGGKIGYEFEVNNFTVGSQSKPVITQVSNSDFIICWLSNDYSESVGIYGKRFLTAPIQHVLTNFNLLEPKIDETISKSYVKFNWNKATKTRFNFPWELTYDLYIDKDENFTNPIIFKEIEDTTYQIDSLTPGNTYFWKVLAKNYYGDSLWSSNVNGFYIDPKATDVKEIISELPNKFELFQNYPNPFNPTTTIRYSIPTVETHGHASLQLKIYDVLGRLVKVLVNETQKPGNYSVEFDGSNLTSGIYYYTVTAGEFSITKKMLLMK